MKDLGTLAKTWCFQQEETKEAKKHWQGRLVLHKRKRLAELIKLVKGTALEGAHWSPTSTAGSKTMSYVMKTDSRIAGPWTDKDVPEEIPETPEDVADVDELLLWQESVINWAIQPTRESRLVWVLLDAKGNMGKSTFARYAKCKHRNVIMTLPPMSEAKDMARMIMSLNKKETKCWIIDIPRALTDEKVLKRIYACAETLKDGTAWDDRYKGRIVDFTPPRVLIITNTVPNIGWMSADRWRIITGPPPTYELKWDTTLLPARPEEPCTIVSKKVPVPPDVAAGLAFAREFRAKRARATEEAIEASKRVKVGPVEPK